ncbi:MAG: AAA family ATPase [Clostridiales bacterium]|nr:AAA family ATPase [Clostridiales bacterium]
MNIQYVLLAAKTMADKAEKEASYGMASAAQSYKTAAKKYREAATLDPSKKDEYIALAESLEAKAEGAVNRPAQQQNAGGGNAPAGPGKPVQKAATATQTAPNPQTAGDKPPVTVEEALAKLNALTGLTGVKETVQAWVSQIRVNQMRASMGLPVPEGFSYHLVFTGNPGTGKTTVANLMADIYRALGILKGGQLVTTSRSDLVAGYEGQTGQKTRERVEEALDGVLFVDEVYALCGNGRDSGKDPFGQEAIDELLIAMENHRDRLVVIVAGYTDLMEKFMDSNPGLKSRMSNVVEFDDYNDAEMLTIFENQCKKHKLVLTNGARSMLKAYFKHLYDTRDKNFGNARTVRNTFQQVFMGQSKRLYKLSEVQDIQDYELMTTLTESDVAFATSQDNNGISPEYKEIQNNITEAGIQADLEQGEYGKAAIALCSRFEGLFKHVYKLNGELYEMINEFRSKQREFSINLTNNNYDCLYRIRTYRNNFVHANLAGQSISPADIKEGLRILKVLEKE